MKRIVFFVCFFTGTCSAVAQQPNVDSIIQQISIEKNADKKVDLVTLFYTPEMNNFPGKVIEMGLQLLKQSQADKNNLEASAAYTMLGQGYRLSGNNIKALDHHHKAIALAEETGNFSLLSMAENQVGHVYKDREQFDKAIQFYASSATHAEKGKNIRIRSWPLLNSASVYLALNKLDSALMYAQRGYELDLKNDRSGLVLAFINLGGVQSKLGNAALAVSYYNMALAEAQGKPYTRYFNMIYSSMAQHYQSAGQTDSCEVYARKAIDAVANTPFFYLSSKPAQLLTSIYEKTNCDSTLKYATVYKTATDSLNNSKISQQIQLMTFDEDLRQQELAAEKIKTGEQRRQNIQYALIALGIIILLSLYLLLSRSFITSAKAIEFFGIIALLIIFEFLNLLLHPFLERITHHSPVLMLLGLVCIAALLVPLHHKIEKWATAKLIEKNKQIRLAAAKRTIEQLEKKQ
ncbi:MAG: tetratricopeptide repeat protein [Rhizobacter sp.]|nr:tetratricopeptide repeat protein [Ferruginibacter sp.]